MSEQAQTQPGRPNVLPGSAAAAAAALADSRERPCAVEREDCDAPECAKHRAHFHKAVVRLWEWARERYGFVYSPPMMPYLSLRPHVVVEREVN